MNNFLSNGVWNVPAGSTRLVSITNSDTRTTKLRWTPLSGVRHRQASQLPLPAVVGLKAELRVYQTLMKGVYPMVGLVFESSLLEHASIIAPSAKSSSQARVLPATGDMRLYVIREQGDRENHDVSRWRTERKIYRCPQNPRLQND